MSSIHGFMDRREKRDMNEIHRLKCRREYEKIYILYMTLKYAEISIIPLYS